MKPNWAEQINEILEEFDFEAVRKYLLIENERFWFLNDPTIFNLQRFAERLLNDLVKSPATNYISTGGFVAEKCLSGCHLSLYFYIAEYDSMNVSNNPICRRH